jgi:hypothetical protein
MRARTACGLSVIAVLVAVAGCGGGGSSDANEPEPSREFLKSGSKNKIAKFGEEADAEEREAASRVLEMSLEAREAAKFDVQCSTLSAKAKEKNKEIAGIQNVAGGGCTKELKARAEPLQISKTSRVNTLTGPIDALRVKDDQGWALYHGKEGTNFAMRMEKENGEWKVGDVLETPI